MPLPGVGRAHKPYAAASIHKAQRAPKVPDVRIFQNSMR